jgi:hypothetical protein
MQFWEVDDVVSLFLNMHAPSGEKSKDSEDSFYEESEQVFLSFA